MNHYLFNSSNKLEIIIILPLMLRNIFKNFEINKNTKKIKNMI